MDPQAVPPAAAPMPPEATEISARLKRILAFPGFAAAARRSSCCATSLKRRSPAKGNGLRNTESVSTCSASVFRPPPRFHSPEGDKPPAPETPGVLRRAGKQRAMHDRNPAAQLRAAFASPYQLAMAEAAIGDKEAACRLSTARLTRARGSSSISSWNRLSTRSAPIPATRRLKSA